MAAKAAKTTTASSAQKTQAQWEKTLEQYLVDKAPALPKSVKDFLVKYGPYLVILGVIMGIQGLIALFQVNSAVSSLYAVVGYRPGAQYYVGVALTAVALVLEGLSVKGLLARRKQGWDMLLYATLINGVNMLLSVNLVGLVLGMLLSLYVLFQLRSYYK